MLDDFTDIDKALFVERLQAFCAQHHNDLLDAYADLSEPLPRPSATLLYSLIALGGSGDIDEALRRLNG